MKNLFLALISLFYVMTAFSQAKENGRLAVQKLCGCFDVEFKYAETFSPRSDYKYHERDEINAGTELVLPLEISATKIILQHLLVINDSVIVKHWREEWSYENPTLYIYKGDGTWILEKLSDDKISGKWTQTVWEVSDAPRYQGIAEWLKIENQWVWQSTTDAPLPRREYTTRSDYNILRRGNRIILTDTGWIHDQDNQKLIRTANENRLLVEEKGINSYHRIDEKYCLAGKNWWEKNKLFWTKVRTTWNQEMESRPVLRLRSSLDGKTLLDQLMELSASFYTGKIAIEEIDARIKSGIEKYLLTGQSKP